MCFEFSLVFFRMRAFLVMSEFRFVMCSLMTTFVPLSFLPCFNSVDLCFLFTNLMIMAYVFLSLFRGRGLQGSMLFKSTSIPFEWKKAATCCSADLSSCSPGSPPVVSGQRPGVWAGFDADPSHNYIIDPGIEWILMEDALPFLKCQNLPWVFVEM